MISIYILIVAHISLLALFVKSNDRSNVHSNVLLNVIFWITLFHFLYYCLPVVFYIINNYSFDSKFMGFSRLTKFDIDAGDLASILWLSLISCITLIISMYLFKRIPQLTNFSKRKNSFPFGKNLILFLLLVLCASKFYNIIANVGADYGSSFKAAMSNSFIINVMQKILGQVFILLEIIFIYGALRAKKNIWLVILFIVTIMEVATTASRGELLQFVLIYIISKELLNRGGSLKIIAFTLFILFTFLTIFGIYRSVLYGDSVGVVFTIGELYNIFSNAVELSNSDLQYGGSLSFELLSWLPGSFMGFSAIAPTQWFVQEYYPAYAETGGGMAFGIVAQAISGGGYVELIIRAFLMALIINLFTPSRYDNGGNWVSNIFLIFFILSAQNMVREGGLSFISVLVQVFIPMILIIRVLPRRAALG
jgi:hypothetical protein